MEPIVSDSGELHMETSELPQQLPKFRNDYLGVRVSTESITKNKQWIQNEISAAEELYKILVEEITETGDDASDVPSPNEFMEDAIYWTDWVDDYRRGVLLKFQNKWQTALDYENYLREKKQLYWTRTEDERIAAFEEEERQVAAGTLVLPQEPPPEFETERAVYRNWMNSKLVCYFGVLAEIYKALCLEPELRGLKFDWSKE